MIRKRIELLAAILLVGGLILAPGCTKVNHDPVISGITATPSDDVNINATITLTANGSDEDGDELIYEWSVTGGGTLSQSTTNTVVWTAPATPGAATVSCVATDGRGGTASANKAVTASVTWRYTSVSAYTPDSTFIATNATTYIAFTPDEAIPDGAEIDSAFVTTDLEPDTIGELFYISIVTPSGTEVMVYDGLNGEPDVDDLLLQGIKGEAAKGNWRLKVVRGTSTIERYADECEVEIYYRYY
jgi:hypothetical protein